MKREHVIATLRNHEEELKALGVLSLSVFGSTGRDDAAADSDVDIAVRLDKHFSKGGLDHLERMEKLAARLSRMLGCHVDVIEEPARKERFQREIDRDRALAF
jgi:predicted nucleotidyltransferase